MRWLIVAFTVALLLCPASANAARKALVIGIDSYDLLPPLDRAIGDAEAMSAKLSELGFSVMTVLNPDRREFNQAITAFRRMLEPGDTAFVHYSGHGIEVDGRNLLLPRDTPLPGTGEEDFLAQETIDLSSLMDRVAESDAAIRIFVVDACRDNPFEREGTRGVGRGGGGLGMIEPPRGSFILYSAGYQQTALDRLGPGDASRTSVYTRVLLEKLSMPGASISEIARSVRADVTALAGAAGHDQSPAYYDELTEDVVLLPGGDERSGESEVSAAFAAARGLGTKGAWDAFLSRYPEGVFADLARAALADLSMPPETSRSPAGAAGVDMQIARQRLAELWAEGEAFTNAGDVAQAFQRMNDARMLAGGYFGTDSEEYADASNRIVGPLSALGRLEEAISASRDAIRIYTALYGDRDLRVLNERGNLAARLAATSRVQEATSIYDELLAIYETLKLRGEAVVPFAHVLEGYAQLALRRADHDEAERYYAKAVAALEEAGMTGVVNYGWIASAFARMLRDDGECARALGLFERAAAAMVRAGVSQKQDDYAAILGSLKQGCSS